MFVFDIVFLFCVDLLWHLDYLDLYLKLWTGALHISSLRVAPLRFWTGSPSPPAASQAWTSAMKRHQVALHTIFFKKWIGVQG